MKNYRQDDIYAGNKPREPMFEFNSKVVDVFPDMIQRSVPGYDQALSLVEVAAANFAVSGSACYDLGCSLGAAAMRMEKATEGMNCEIIAVDNSSAMINQLKRDLANLRRETRIRPVLSDVLAMEMRNISLATMNFTLQFVPFEFRTTLLKTVKAAMNPGGAFVLSEKISFNSQEEAELMELLHLEFKRCNGYSDLEIARKRAALENVLVPETIEDHLNRLRSVGFAQTFVALRNLNFATIIAVN